MKLLYSLFSGLLFGAGLIVSGMTDPGKVQAFLDVAGPWDPSLGFVMAGAIAVAGIAFRLGKRWGIAAHQPAELGIDSPLIIGSLLFGIGWGVAGICPGPALVGVGAGLLPASVFVICMLFGMEAHAWLAEGPAGQLADTPNEGQAPDRPEAF